MIKSTTSIFNRSLSALVIVCAMAAFTAQPATAQTAKKLNCNGCVKSKQLKNNGIKSRDIRNGQVKNADLATGAVNSAKVQDGSLTGADIKDNSIGPADLAPGTALGISGVLHIPAAAFTPARDTTLHEFVPFAGYLRGRALNTNHSFYAPVQLPDGVVITRLDGFMRDNSTTRNISLSLIKLDPAAGASLFLTSVGTGGLPNSTSVRTVSETAIPEPLVDAINTSYYLLATVGTGSSLSNTVFYGARIFYD